MARGPLFSILHPAVGAVVKVNQILRRVFLVLDISGTPLRVRRAPGLSSLPGGCRCPTRFMLTIESLVPALLQSCCNNGPGKTHTLYKLLIGWRSREDYANVV